MTNSKHNDTHLRDTHRMMAYLRDEVKPEEIEQIEDLMERDPLYRLSMEQLSEVMAEHGQLAAEKVDQLQKQLPELLLAGKARFVQQLDAGLPTEGVQAGGRLPWKKFVLIASLVILASLGILLLWPGGELHKQAANNLMPEEDVMLAHSFVEGCNEELPGIGRGKAVSIYSAIVEHFAAENYRMASRQLEQIAAQQVLSEDCNALLMFYLAQSNMALKDYKKAELYFQTALNLAQNQPALRNAIHWYMGNMALQKKDTATARTHFEALAQADAGAAEQHLKSLLEKDYLQLAQQYLERLNKP
ncbi:MAG: hypothetical protein D6730_17330 [Bacteroidetes bacterium]|nr:MAG: hypothetical protein D6730_17330 [Bacteroidota bacterium]